MQRIENLHGTIARLQGQLKTYETRITRAQHDLEAAERDQRRIPHTKVSALKLQTAQITLNILCQQKESIEQEIARLQRASSPEHHFYLQEIYNILYALGVQRRARQRQIKEVSTILHELTHLPATSVTQEVKKKQEQYTLLLEFLRAQLRMVEDQIIYFTPGSPQ